MYRRIRMPSPLLHCLVVSLSLDFLCRCSPFLANLSWPLFLGRLSSSFALRFVLSRPQPKSLSPLFVTYPLVITIITDGSLVHVFLSLSLSLTSYGRTSFFCEPSIALSLFFNRISTTSTEESTFRQNRSANVYVCVYLLASCPC